jgi:sugar-specific transcriptional regulator TrmB
MYKKVFEQAGLSKEQADIYKILLEKGASTAKTVSLSSGIKRGLAYKTLEKLEILGLITKEEEKGSVAKFYPSHPKNLEKIIQNKKNDLDQSSNILESILPELVSNYNLSIGKPNVQSFEGLKGLNHLYQDILKTKKDIKIIRSAKDVEDKEVESKILEQIDNQVKAGINVDLIGPTNPKATLSNDIKNNVTRRSFDPKNFTLPAQIIIYGDKVGITAFDESMITTIVDSPAIKQTMESIFSLLWKNASE